jgi:hypothetical protein
MTTAAALDDSLALPPGNAPPEGWNPDYWVCAVSPRPFSDDQWLNWIQAVSGCERHEISMGIYGYSMRIYFYVCDPYYAEKLLATNDHLDTGPQLEGLWAGAYLIKVYGVGYTPPPPNLSPTLTVSGVRNGYTVGTGVSETYT